MVQNIPSGCNIFPWDFFGGFYLFLCLLAVVLWVFLVGFLLVCGDFFLFSFVVVGCFFLEGKFLIDAFFTSLLHLFLFDVSF